MKEAYCSYEVSKLLKEKGFKEECYTFYEYNSKGFYREERVSWNTSYSKDCAAPTHQMAMAWLRDKGYHIYTFMRKDNIWVYEVQSLNEDWTFSLGGFSSHDEAVEEGIKYALKKLI